MTDTVSGPVIAPVVLHPCHGHPRAVSAGVPDSAGTPRGLPLPSIAAPAGARRAAATVYGMARADTGGRLANRAVIGALAWAPGTALAISITGGLPILTPTAGSTADAAPEATSRITDEMYLRLPARLRRRCGITAGDRLLLAADPAADRLVIYPPAVLDAALADYRSGLAGDDPA